MSVSPFFELSSALVADESAPDAPVEFRFRGGGGAASVVRPDGAVAALRWLTERIAAPTAVAVQQDSLRRALEEADYWERTSGPKA